MRECIFCGATSDITREHIWADWLKEYIAKDIDGYQAATITINQPGVASTVREKKISGDPRSRKVKCVCGSCNNGWMSQLQERAKPLVLSLIEGCQIEFTKAKCELLSAWIAMSVMCSEYSDRSRVAIRPLDRKRLFESHKPPTTNWRIWIGRFERQKTQAIKINPNNAVYRYNCGNAY